MVHKTIPLKEIGYVSKGIDSIDKSTIKSKLDFIGEITIYMEFREGLKGIDDYSHLFIISYLHKADRRLVYDARKRGGPSLIGVFATRFPGRPNPIGLSLVELINRRGNVLEVRGLDLYTDTPILDIKPYDYYDIVCRPRVPRWSYEEWARKEGIYRKYGWPGPYC